jgi:N-acetylglucosamine malate deacetylase 1
MIIDTKNKKNVLILAPHTDDGEFGCGGTIAKLIQNGSNIIYAAFSIAEESLEEGLPKDTLEKEVKEATSILGIKSSNLIIHKFPVRNFLQYRQDILELLVQINIDYNPDLVFLPSRFDTHQDHKVISDEGFRAFKKTSILGYEIPWNNLTFNTNAFSLLEKKHIDKKIESLNKYISQMNRSYVNKEFIESLAITRGGQIGVQYAETFEAVRLIL